MDQLPKELEELLQSSQTPKWVKNKAAIVSLLHSPEGKQLAALLQQQGNSATLQNAAQAAAKGNPKALAQLIEQIKSNQESMELLSKLSSQLPK